MTPLLLDLYCGAGGAGKGYSDAGFDVVGIDTKHQPRYPFDHMEGDAILTLEGLLEGRRIYVPTNRGLRLREFTIDDFAAVHASPPCQAYSRLKTRWQDREQADLVDATRQLLRQTGLPYVIENVIGAPLENPIMLCGTQFGLRASDRQVHRHRLFESNVPMMASPCWHRDKVIGVYGHGGGHQMTRGYKANLGEAREALGIDWMQMREISQAIPPAYTEHIGGYLMAELARVAA